MVTTGVFKFPIFPWASQESMMWYSREDWEHENTCCKHKILPWIPRSLFTVHTCMCPKSCPKECFYKPFKRTLHDYTSFEENNGQYNTKNIEVCDRHARHRWGTYNEPCIQTYSWKEKLTLLMLPRFQGSLQRTKTLILKPGKRFMWIYRSTLWRQLC